MGKLIIVLLLLTATVIAVILTVRRFARLRRMLRDSQERNYEIDKFLVEFSRGLQDANGLSEAMHSICRHIADQVDAESVAVYEFANDELTVTGVCGFYPLVRSKNRQLVNRQRYLFEALKRDPVKLGEGFLGETAQSLEPQKLDDAGHDERFSDTFEPERLGGIMVVPLVADNLLRGIICAVNNRRGAGIPFSEAQFQHLVNMAPQVLLMQELVRSYSEMSRRDRIDQELEFARQIQFSLLPEAFPSWDQFSVNAFTRPAKEVNGDFYDFVEIDADRLLIVIGDACGKGVPACMLTAMTRSFIRALADNFTTLGDFLIKLNRNLYHDTDAERFVTLNCCLLDKKNSLLEFGRAGHTELITFVRNHLRVIYPEGPGLGILPEEFAHFDTFTLTFEPGMSFLVFSDGITEAVDTNGEEFGLKRLEEVFRDSLMKGDSSQNTIERILGEVSKFAAEQLDDQTLILIQHN